MHWPVNVEPHVWFHKDLLRSGSDHPWQAWQTRPRSRSDATASHGRPAVALYLFLERASEGLGELLDPARSKEAGISGGS